MKIQLFSNLRTNNAHINFKSHHPPSWWLDATINSINCNCSLFHIITFTLLLVQYSKTLPEGGCCLLGGVDCLGCWPRGAYGRVCGFCCGAPGLGCLCPGVVPLSCAPASPRPLDSGGLRSRDIRLVIPPDDCGLGWRGLGLIIEEKTPYTTRSLATQHITFRTNCRTVGCTGTSFVTGLLVSHY